MSPPHSSGVCVQEIDFCFGVGTPFCVLFYCAKIKKKTSLFISSCTNNFLAAHAS